MLENMDNSGLDRPEREPMQDKPAAERPVSDREVPLDAHARGDARETIHQWLDGELSEAAARRADERQVQFWSAVNVQTEQRRRMTTPTHVTAAIMQALPVTSPSRNTSSASSTVDGKLSLTPLSAAAAAAGFTALGVLIGRVIGR